jgi:16S rRNA (guanine(966)-N(2))-methyltransferase RsmD
VAKSAAKQLNTVRINAGTWRSRLIKFPDAEGLRPSPERVRQTLFNWLGQDLSGLHCLDLFAGTGVMGFEALSRGASAVTMVEKSSLACAALHANKTLLNAAAASIVHQDALQFLAQNSQSYQLIFLDPPYNKAWLAQVMPQLASCLHDDGRLYVEAEFALDEAQQADSQPFLAGWQVLKQSKAGNVFYHLLKLAKIE